MQETLADTRWKPWGVCRVGKQSDACDSENDPTRVYCSKYYVVPYLERRQAGAVRGGRGRRRRSGWRVHRAPSRSARAHRSPTRPTRERARRPRSAPRKPRRGACASRRREASPWRGGARRGVGAPPETQAPSSPARAASALAHAAPLTATSRAARRRRKRQVIRLILDRHQIVSIYGQNPHIPVSRQEVLATPAIGGPSARVRSVEASCRSR